MIVKCRFGFAVLCLFILFSLKGVGQTKIDSIHYNIQRKTGEDRAISYLELSNSYKSLFPDSAIYFANKALSIGESKKNSLIKARSYSALGEIYQLKTQLQESIEYYFKAIDIAEKSDEKTSLGGSYNGLGISFYYLNDLVKAEFYTRKAAEIKLELKDYTYYSVITTNLAAIFFYNERYAESIDLLKNAEIILIDEKQDYYLSSLYNSLGGTYRMGLNDLDSSEYFYKKSLEIALEFDIINNIITGYHNLGELSFVRKDYNRSIEYLKKGEEYCIQNNNIVFSVAIFTTLSEVYEAIHDYKSAFKYKNLQMVYKDSIFRSEKQKAIEELEFKFQTAKSQQQIQQQKEELQTASLKVEKQKNQTYLILFIGITLLLIASFIILYFIQRKKSNQLVEREKSKLFENIVHEIRTPLTLITGPLQLVKKKMNADNGLHEHIQMIEHNSDKLVRLVNELLDVSKLEKGKYQLSFQQGDLNQFIYSLITNFKSEATQKDIEIVWEPLEGVHKFKYASNAIEQIVFNLIGNALKYCPSKSKVIISLKLESDDVVFTVSDNGPGISEKDQLKVFERFFRINNNESIKGTGIGLAMVKELTELMNGNINLKSNVGKGAVFSVTIPIEKLSFTSERKEIDELKPHILIVDDEEDILQFVGSLLHNDFNVITAKNGDEGMNKVLEYIPEVVLTDVMMPIKNGLELLRDIKSNELTNHIPVVVFSAKSSLESRIEGLSFGADAYLPKPFNPDELQLIIKNILKTIQRNQQDFQKVLKTQKAFDERIFTKNEYVNKAILLVIEHLSKEAYSVNELANDLCVSRSQLHRKLTSQTGFSATNFIRMIRLEKAKDLLANNWGNVTDIAYACGFNSQSYFTKSFTEYFGESPSKYMK